MAQDYQATITSYVQQGYIRKLPDEEMKQVPGWLLPHFPVFRPERQTTKTRIVFDASAKHKGVSLNDEIQIAPPDRQYFRFLWRDLDIKRKPEVYEFE